MEASLRLPTSLPSGLEVSGRLVLVLVEGSPIADEEEDDDDDDGEEEEEEEEEGGEDGDGDDDEDEDEISVPASLPASVSPGCTDWSSPRSSGSSGSSGSSVGSAVWLICTEPIPNLCVLFLGSRVEFDSLTLLRAGGGWAAVLSRAED